jgi:hypothetical protein
LIRVVAGIATTIATAALLSTPMPRTKRIVLPAGTVDVYGETVLESGTEVIGAAEGTILRMAPNFNGRAVFVAQGSGIRLRDFTIEGNRDTHELRAGLPAYDLPFARFTRANGIFAQSIDGLRVDRVAFRNIGGFAVLGTRARRVTLNGLYISDSGSRNSAGRNNTTGGILLEEGSAGFRVTNCMLRNIRGNGIWTHSLYTSPRNGPGRIANNRIELVGRDAIQVGHAFDVRVEDNSGGWVGYPWEDVDMDNRAIPVAIDTAGNVERSVYNRNRFVELNGKCIDLDGFHNGEVRGNVCENRGMADAYKFGGYGIVMNNTNPDMQSSNIRVVDNVIDGPLFGGIFVIGSGHLIARNRLVNLNLAHCNEEAARFGCYYAAGEPDMLRSGIYLGRGAERPAPARGNTIEGNVIAGFEMKSRCIGRAPGIEENWNVVRGNDCK